MLIAFRGEVSPGCERERGEHVASTIDISTDVVDGVAMALRGAASAVGQATCAPGGAPLTPALDPAVESLLRTEQRLRVALARALDTAAEDVTGLRNRAEAADR